MSKADYRKLDALFEKYASQEQSLRDFVSDVINHIRHNEEYAMIPDKNVSPYVEILNILSTYEEEDDLGALDEAYGNAMDGGRRRRKRRSTRRRIRKHRKTQRKSTK